MQDFNFHNPTQISFGRGKAVKAGETVAQFGLKALFVFGKDSIAKSGLRQSITNSLRAAGVEFTDHGGVQPNPALAHVREGVEKVRSGKLTVILAVGGGSVMDEAKAIAAGAMADFDPWEFFAQGKRPRAALPVVAVPTMAATGSEMNGNTVITNPETKEKLGMFSPLLYPKVSLLDPELTLSVPANYTAYGLADIFSHIMEPYFGGMDQDTPVQDRLAEGLFQSLFDIAPRLAKDPKDYQARADMMWASTVALCGVLAAGRGKAFWDNHLLAHALGALFDAPHGAALAVVMPGWMAHAAETRAAKLTQFARRVMGAQTAAEGTEKLKDWFRAIGAPVTLGELGIKGSDIPSIVANVMATGGGTDTTRQADVERIYRLCL